MVGIIKSQLVVPSEETPKTSLWLSNLDLVATRRYVQSIYFYRSDGNPDFFSVVETLISSLAKALVPFYPLAGRLGMSPDGRIEINCNGEGALFVVACSDAILDDFGDFVPSSEMRNMFIPPAESPELPCILIMLQVTFFKCGGVALGVAMLHTVVDGRCAFHFLETWSSIARGETNHLPPPFLDRTFLRARPNPTISFNHAEYKPNPTSIVHSGIRTSYTISILKVSMKHVNALKLLCGDATGVPVSRFCAVIALVRRCVCLARKLDLGVETRMHTMIDMRSRMNPPLPATYFGNAVIHTSVSASVDYVVSNPINYVAKRIREATNQGDEYVKSLIDYLETADKGKLMRTSLLKSDLQVISWLGMPIYNTDFGWGKPIFLQPAQLSCGGYVYLMDTPEKDAGVLIVISLEPEILPEFEKMFFEKLAGLEAE